MDMDPSELVTVFTVGNPAKAEIIRNFLESEGIFCFLDGINQAGEVGLNVLDIGIQVRPADADRARKLIESHEARHRRAEEGSGVGDE
jgi:hypothetical protein